MVTLAEHKRRIKEHLEEINDAIDIGIQNKPITIGFHCSACACELLEFYLHKLGVISTGKIIKHNWFKRPQQEQKIVPLIERKLAVHFPNKEKIYNLIYAIEENRDNLVYGKVIKTQIEIVLTTFVKLKELLLEKLSALGEKIE